MRLRLPERRTRSGRMLARRRPREGYRAGRPRSAVVVVLALACIAAGCGVTSGASPAASLRPVRESRRRAHRDHAPGPAPGSTTTTLPTTTVTAAGSIGSFLVFRTLGGVQLHVTVEKLIDPAAGADPLSIPELGNHFVGAVLSVTSSATTTQDINADTSLVGSTGRIFAHDDDPITGCTNFTPGPLQVPPGSALTGCVTFQVPTSAQIGSVQFTPTSGAAGSQVGRWSIG